MVSGIGFLQVLANPNVELLTDMNPAEIILKPLRKNGILSDRNRAAPETM